MMSASTASSGPLGIQYSCGGWGVFVGVGWWLGCRMPTCGPAPAAVASQRQPHRRAAGPRPAPPPRCAARTCAPASNHLALPRISVKRMPATAAMAHRPLVFSASVYHCWGQGRRQRVGCSVRVARAGRAARAAASHPVPRAAAASRRQRSRRRRVARAEPQVAGAPGGGRRRRPGPGDLQPARGWTGDRRRRSTSGGSGSWLRHLRSCGAAGTGTGDHGGRSLTPRQHLLLPPPPAQRGLLLPPLAACGQPRCVSSMLLIRSPKPLSAGAEAKGGSVRRAARHSLWGRR